MPRSLTDRPTTKRENKYLKYDCFSPEGDIFCFCDTDPRLAAVLRKTQSNKNGNRGRKFWACPGVDEQCEFFLWNDQLRDKGYVGYLDVEESDWEEDEDIFDVGPQGHYGQPLGGGTAGMRTPPPTPQSKKKQPAAKQTKSKKRYRSESEDEEDEEDDDSSDGDPDDVQVTPTRASGSESFKCTSSSKAGSSHKKQKVPIGGSPTSARRQSQAPRPPSPAASPPAGAESEVARLRREMAAMKRQLEAKNKTTTQLAKENDEYRAENSQLLEKAYPELFQPSQGSQS